MVGRAGPWFGCVGGSAAGCCERAAGGCSGCGGRVDRAAAWAQAFAKQYFFNILLFSKPREGETLFRAIETTPKMTSLEITRYHFWNFPSKSRVISMGKSLVISFVKTMKFA